MVQLARLCLFILFISDALAISIPGSYNPGYFGEKNFEIYHGPQWPDFQLDPYYNSLIWQDNEYNKSYIYSLLQNNFSELDNFFERNLHQAMICSNEAIGEKFKFLRYINRLVSVSYLFESLRKHLVTARSLHLSQTCEINWKNELEKCRPKSSDMKYFLRNAQLVVANQAPILISADSSVKKFREQWISKFENNDLEDLSHHRLKQSCQSCNGVLSLKTLAQEMQKMCQEELKLFHNICSEDDQIYGLSQIPQAYNLIVSSEILNAINQDEQARGCLRRFNYQLRNKEYLSPILKLIFPMLYEQLKSAPYPQGSLFPAGAMKEFQDKGLVSVFEITPEGNKEKVSVVKPVAKVEVENKTFPAVKTNKKEVPPVKVPLEKTIVARPEGEIQKSSFLLASEFRQRYDIEVSKVDMLKFKYDYIFPMKLVAVMKKSMSEFMTKKSLIEMKKFDALGTKSGPVPLTFIKYMIDQQLHQGLYSLIDVLGDEFYVKNNIDQQLAPAYDLIKLKNDATTEYEWQILIVKE